MRNHEQLVLQAKEYRAALPDRIRTYLHGRGIPDAVIDLHLLGWNGERITIPIFDRDGRLVFFRLAKDPTNKGAGPKMLSPTGAGAELYGWERLRVKPCRVVICEGEFDRLVLEARGFPAVTSTGGAGVFKPAWADVFSEIPEVFICFDRDSAGQIGARRVAQLIPHARVVKLPKIVGEGGDVGDFFVGLGRGREEFGRLLEAARPLPALSLRQQLSPAIPASATGRSAEVAHVKEQVPLKSVVERYVELRPVGRTWRGTCPFHPDEIPSFVVYPEDEHFHCFGCGSHGDVLSFLMKIERLTFLEALQALQRECR